MGRAAVRRRAAGSAAPVDKNAKGRGNAALMRERKLIQLWEDAIGSASGAEGSPGYGIVTRRTNKIV